MVWARLEDREIRLRHRQKQVGNVQKRAFTLVELLVVISIISAAMAIMLPACGRVQRQARMVLSMSNQKQITCGVTFFASDNNERYPESVATIGFGSNWNWSDPTKLTGNRRRSPGLHRAMSEYLRSYIADASTMYCPNAPQKYKYLQEAWDAGDEWDNPETPVISDPVGGTYCFYWNYLGYLGDPRLRGDKLAPAKAGVFRGPQGPASGGWYSKLLVTDYLGYDHWRSPGAYGSCEKFNGAGIVAETWLLSAYWCGKGDGNGGPPEIRVRAGYSDGHVESYSITEAVPMRVAITADGTVPYPDGVGPGVFFLPTNALH